MSQLRLTGTGGGNTILNGNDTITTDQTFEFPDDGGTLLTTAGNTTNDGSGGSSGSAQVVGYQQGSWTPDPTVGDCTVGTAMWSRVGNLVLIQANLTAFTNTSSGSTLELTGLPYNRDPNMFPTAACRSSYLNFGEDNNIICCIVNTNRIRFQASRPSVGGTPAPGVQVLQFSNFITANQADTGIAFTLSYLTSNTDWTPINGATVS